MTEAIEKVAQYFPAGLPVGIKIPEKKADAHSVATNYVMQVEQPKAMSKVLSLAAKDVNAFTREMAHISNQSAARITLLAVLVAEKVEGAVKAEKDALASSATISREVLNLADTLVPTIITALEAKMMAMPASLTLYASIRQNASGKGVHVTFAVGKDIKSAFPAAESKGKGKRGRESKWSSIELIDVKGEKHVFGDLQQAAKWFSKPSDANMPYSQSSYTTKATKGYDAKSVTFLEKVKAS